MGWKTFFSWLFILLIIVILAVYWFVPLSQVEFKLNAPKNPNFSLNGEDMQFYKNMRFASSNISYNIADCSLQKKNDMENAFQFIENKTILKFYPVVENQEITITCSNRNKIEGDLFIAGEGGPINISQTELFNIIWNGKILLIRESRCPQPNIGIHELLHVLGFNHSTNKGNIMYPISNCDQVVSEDMINFINKIYAIPSLSDLAFSNASVILSGKFLDVEMTVWNNGLADSGEGKIKIYAGESLIKTVDLDKIETGYGRQISLGNIFIPKFSVNKVSLVIEGNFSELDKENNRIELEVKN